MSIVSNGIVQDVLGKNGVAVQSGLQYRPQQEQMSLFVQARIRNDDSGAVEAGTGSGKSYAYLVPAMEAARDGKVIVISTATINLQEQLVLKDIPAVQKMTGIDPRAVLVKGRSNYVSLRRLERAQKAARAIPGSEYALGLKDAAGLVQGGYTERGEFSVPPADDIWTAISSDKDDCMGKKCSHFQSCPFHIARREQFNAGILVVNHALLCADLRLKDGGSGVLPDYDCVIIDEAHEFPGTASTAFGERISLQQIKHLMKSVEQDAVRFMTGSQRKDTVHFVSTVKGLLEPSFELCHKSAEDGLSKPLKTKIPEFLQEIADNVSALAKDMDDPEAKLNILMVRRRCADAARAFRKWQSIPNGFVSFSEQTKRNITLVQSPISVGPMLQKTLYDQAATVMTSATLGTGYSLEFFKEEVGLRKSDPELQVGSPFDYRRNVQLRVEKSMPDPRDPKYSTELNQQVKAAISRSSGGNLVLFTSYRQMNETKAALGKWIKQQGYTFLCQGKDISRKEIVNTMKSDPNCVVFGTDSFWQGVDIPGRNLRSVVITKLPFRVPDNPVLKKRFEILEKEGRNPFFHYSLPEATMKLKQGFGRLVRTETDTGEVVILDSRVSTKAYGKQMLSALPACGELK